MRPFPAFALIMLVSGACDSAVFEPVSAPPQLITPAYGQVLLATDAPPEFSWTAAEGRVDEYELRVGDKDPLSIVIAADDRSVYSMTPASMAQATPGFTTWHVVARNRIMQHPSLEWKIVTNCHFLPPDLSLVPDPLPASALHQDLQSTAVVMVNSGGGVYAMDGIGPEFRYALQTDLGCGPPQNTDVVFVVDTTGSMIHAITNLATLLEPIFNDLSVIPSIHVAVTAYGDRDHDGSRWIQQSPMTPDIQAARDYLTSRQLLGGGDIPESLHDAMAWSVTENLWRDGSNRLMVVITDAPSKTDGTVEYSVNQLEALIVENNIRVMGFFLNVP